MALAQTGNCGEVIAQGSQLIGQFGVAGVVALVAEIIEQRADCHPASGERQNATRRMLQVRVQPRAAQMLES